MIPDLVINKIYQYNHNYYMKKLCKEYHSKFTYHIHTNHLYYKCNDKYTGIYVLYHINAIVYPKNFIIFDYWYKWKCKMYDTHYIIRGNKPNYNYCSVIKND